MNEQKLKPIHKHIQCHIVKWANDIKLFWIKYILWIKYVRKNELWTEEHTPGERICPPGDSSLPLYVPYYLCTYHQAESIQTISFSLSFTNLRFEWKSELTRTEHARTKFFFIRMKIRIRNKPASKWAASSKKRAARTEALIKGRW